MLPHIEKWKLPKNEFPTLWQTVIFRNYGYVSNDKIAKTLRCLEETVVVEAERLGLKGHKYEPIWEKKGYITIIRNNWWLLPYSQLQTLLGVSEEQLDFILKEEDFLSVKLGWCKPVCEEVFYSPLSDDEIARTKIVCATLKVVQKIRYCKPFDFYNRLSGTQNFVGSKSDLMIHSYQTPCGNAFAIGSEEYLPDILLEEYARRGIKGLWFHGILSSLSAYPFKPSLSSEYRENRKRLKELIARAKKYGIGIYLYFNEPRSLSIDDFKNQIIQYKGHTFGKQACLCFSQRAIQEYLYGAVKDLLEDLKELRGIITITMSENPTHCRFQGKTTCPACATVSNEYLSSLVNNIFYRAARDSGTGTEVIANLWGWKKETIDGKQRVKGVELLDKGISIMAVSETDLQIEHGGVRLGVVDYSMSHVGPSDFSKNTLCYAKELGHKIYAKIQVNNSWECSSVPALPVFDLVEEHIKKLQNIGVDGYMLSWTLGGYPSLNLDLVSALTANNAFVLSEWYKKHFQENAEEVHRAVTLFCRGFRHFPFSVNTLYYSPKNVGCANLWDLETEEKISAMVGFSFDDYENWIKPYPYEVYVSEYKRLLFHWKQGLKILRAIQNDIAVGETLLFAETAYLHFEADLLQTEFSYYKRKENFDAERLLKITRRALRATKELLFLQSKDARIGYEASNHYFYTKRTLVEKILNCINIIKRLEGRI